MRRASTNNCGARTYRENLLWAFLVTTQSRTNGVIVIPLCWVVFGNLVVQFTLFSLVAWLGRGNDQLGYRLAAALCGMFAAALFVFTFLSTRERVEAPAETMIGQEIAA